MTCGHDAMFRRENEANGGIGCPICNRRRIAAKHAAVNPDEPRFDIHAASPIREGWISNTARMVDGDDVTPEWMAEIWPTLPEIEY